MKNQVISTLGLYGLIPVVVLDDVDAALPLADAYERAGLPVMEITLRTVAGLPSIERLCAQKPDFYIGAGTVLTLEQCRQAVAAGADFIVTPGFNTAIVEWCVDNNVCVVPGCVTPAEIELALAYGIKTVKFFPASVYGGVKACAALHGPYGPADVRFVPTGGVDLGNLDEYADKSYIAAIGGGWLCDKKAIAAGDFAGVESVVRDSIDRLLGFALAHVGVNTADEAASLALARDLHAALGMPVREGNTSVFAGDGFELMKAKGPGANGHIAIRTNSVERAVFYLDKRGFAVDEATAKYKNGRLNAVYLEKEFGGFAVHLLQK